MKICPKCGTPLERHGRGKETRWVCPVCGYETVGSSEPPRRGGIAFIPKEETGKGIIEEKEFVGALSEITICPKCGHSPVYYTFLQTRAADEPPVRIYKCPKCGYSWREYS